MKKRIGSFFLAIVMLFTLVVPAFAQSITLVVDKDTVKAGEDVTVTVNFDEDLEKVSGLALNLHFNSNLFTYKEGQKFDNYAFIVKGEEGTAPDQYKVINWASLEGVGTIKAGKYVTCTFTAKQDIVDLTTAEFVAKVDMDNTTMAPGYGDPTYPDSKISVNVTPASTEPEGYAVAASAVNSSITVKEDAQVALKITNKDVTTYNAYYMEVSYDTNVLTYKGINTDASVTDNNGILKIAGYGEDKTCGTNNIILTFTGKTTGEAKVNVTSAKVDVKANAAEKNAPAATITTGAATITVGGYQVSLPDGFTGEGTANPGKDYTFTANDRSKKYDFTGSTMGGKSVNVIDKGNGNYAVENVTGPLVITATEKVGKVKINLTNNTNAVITGIADGQEVDPGKECPFMIIPAEGKVPVVTVNGTVLEGTPIMGGQRYQYNIAAGQVTGTELNIVVNYKSSTDTITIIGSGDAWSDVDHNSSVGWEESGKVTDKATAALKIRPATGKTIEDYVVTINGKTQDLTQEGRGPRTRYMVAFVPADVAKDNIIKIDVSYKKAPEPTITVDVSEYLNLSGKTMFLITAACGELTEGKVLAYDKNQMYWSAKYNESNGAYAWLVISDKGLEEVKAEAEAAITAVDGAKVEIAYNGDVNLTNAADINDAQLVWNMYNAEYSDFQKVNVRKFLEADMTADGKLDTADAAAIIALITE